MLNKHLKTNLHFITRQSIFKCLTDFGITSFATLGTWSVSS